MTPLQIGKDDIILIDSVLAASGVGEERLRADGIEVRAREFWSDEGPDAAYVAKRLWNLQRLYDKKLRLSVVIGLRRQDQWLVYRLDGPDRLVLDLQDVVSRLESQRYGVAQGGVIRIRASQHTLEPAPVARVVFDLDQPLPYRITQDGAKIKVVFGEQPVVCWRGSSYQADPVTPLFPNLAEAPEIDPILARFAMFHSMVAKAAGQSGAPPALARHRRERKRMEVRRGGRPALQPAVTAPPSSARNLSRRWPK